MKTLPLVLFLALCAAITTGCGGGEKKPTAPKEAVQEQYQCPMKCTEEIFSKPGKCPVCEMELEKVTKG